MPSINRPTWRGVSTTGIDHIAEELSRLERSTILMRQNLDNANANRINNSSETLRIDDCDAIAGVTEAVSIENEDLSSVLQSLETSSEELKLKIRSVLKSNAEIKLEMKTYLEQSEAWNLTFEQESKKIDAEIEAVTSLTSLEKESVSEGKLTTIIASKARSWYNVLGTVGRNVVLNIRRKWQAVELREFLLVENENNNHDVSAYALIPYM